MHAQAAAAARATSARMQAAMAGVAEVSQLAIPPTVAMTVDSRSWESSRFLTKVFYGYEVITQNDGAGEASGSTAAAGRSKHH